MHRLRRTGERLRVAGPQLAPRQGREKHPHRANRVPPAFTEVGHLEGALIESQTQAIAAAAVFVIACALIAAGHAHRTVFPIIGALAVQLHAVPTLGLWWALATIILSHLYLLLRLLRYL